MSSCAWVQEHAATVVRGDVPDELRGHLEACTTCQKVAAGAALLRADLDLLEAPEPPADLVANTLARLALAGRAPHVEVSGSEAGSRDLAPITPLPSRRRRTSVEFLTSAPLETTNGPPSPRRLLLRLCLQAAAALVLFGICTAFVVVYYPAVTYALEDGRLKNCQERLVRLQKAALRYRAEHPDSPELRDQALSKALVEGGYLDPLDLVCPGHRGKELQERSYLGKLPAGSQALDPDRPIFWDRFGNHSTGYNAVFASGRVETVPVDDFAGWHSRLKSGARDSE